MESTTPEKTDTEKILACNIKIHNELEKEFFELKSEIDTPIASKAYRLKLTSSLGYLQQIHTGLVKAYDVDKRLTALEEKRANRS